MLLYLAAFFLPLCVSAIDLRTTSTSCTKAAVVEGVPTDVSFEHSSPTTNLSEAVRNPVKYPLVGFHISHSLPRNALQNAVHPNNAM